MKAIMNWASDQKQVVDAVGWSDARAANGAIAAAKQLAMALAQNARDHLGQCVEAVEVGPNSIRIAVDLVGSGIVKPGTANEFVEITVPAQRKRCGMAVRLVIGGPDAPPAREPDQTLISLMSKAREWLQRLTFQGQGIGEIAQQEKVSPGYATRMVHLAHLALGA